MFQEPGLEQEHLDSDIFYHSSGKPFRRSTMKKTSIFLFLCALVLMINSCQSRAVSRWTGSALKLELPEDFDKPISHTLIWRAIEHAKLLNCKIFVS